MGSVEVATIPTSRACRQAILMADNGPMMIGGLTSEPVYVVPCNSPPLPNVFRVICARYRYILQERRSKQSIANWRRGTSSATKILTK
jgi:hypothetical protein